MPRTRNATCRCTEKGVPGGRLFHVREFPPSPVRRRPAITGALQNVEVARVVDGDTVRLRDGRSVRLIGINAPELAHNGRTTEPLR